MAEEEAKPKRRRGAANTALQLVVASIVVGAILAVLDISPINFWRGIFHSVQDVLDLIGANLSEVVRRLLSYLILGAAIVLPIWIILRIIRFARDRC